MSATQMRQIEETSKAPVPVDEEGSDRRESPRVPARDLADIVTDGARYAITCMVRNLSGTGALIEAGTRDVPERFVLVNHVRKFRSVCRVVWRSGGLVGVRFVTPPREFR